MKKRTIHYAVAAAFVAASAASNVAHAVVETETNESRNDSIATAQHLDVVNGRVEVTGSIGEITKSVPVSADIDFYSFEATEGDQVTIDINGGIKDFFSESRSVDTNLAVFGPDGMILRENDDVLPEEVDAGSLTEMDARIINFVVPATGTYVVGVSSFGRFFTDQGGLTSTFVNPNLGNGSYTLTLEGVTTPVLVQPMNIDIKPRHAGVARLYPHAEGKVAVALLSSGSYDALKVDRASLTFGPTGDESSLVQCHKDPVDVNRDGYKDLVCRFDIRAAGFEVGDLEGILKGTAEGKKFEGRGSLKVIQKTKKRKHGDRDHGDRHDRDDDRRGHGNRGHGGRG